MSEKRYTLTLYIAPPGGIIKHKDNKGNVIKTETSSVGHVYYAISEDGGIHKKGYGFFSYGIFSNIYGACCCK